MRYVQADNIIEISNLEVGYLADTGCIKAVDGASFFAPKGKITALVGESGCGKSTLAFSILKLLPPWGRIFGGSITFNGENLLEKDDEHMRQVRGREISMVFQDPLSSLNPFYSVGNQIIESLKLHINMESEESWKKAAEVLELLNMPDPVETLHKYPFELSGGMRQRAMIAMAISTEPKLIIADEPTSFLDVTTQAQIIKLLYNLKLKLDTSIILITHDLGIVAELCDYVAVMYAGEIVEWGDVFTVLKNAVHPYTEGLIRCIPRIEDKPHLPEEISGELPDPKKSMEGCKFNSRCPRARAMCRKQRPEFTQISTNHFVECFYPTN